MGKAVKAARDFRKIRRVGMERKIPREKFKRRGPVTLDRKKPPLQTKGGAPSSSFDF